MAGRGHSSLDFHTVQGLHNLGVTTLGFGVRVQQRGLEFGFGVQPLGFGFKDEWRDKIVGFSQGRGLFVLGILHIFRNTGRGIRLNSNPQLLLIQRYP